MPNSITGARINGLAYTSASITVYVAGSVFEGFRGIKYPEKRSRNLGYGGAPHGGPRARPKGKYEPGPGALAGFQEDVEKLMNFLATLAADKKSYGNVEFDIQVQFVENGKQSTHTIHRCALTGVPMEIKGEADEAIEQEIEFDFFFVDRNGKTLFDSSKGTP